MNPSYFFNFRSIVLFFIVLFLFSITRATSADWVGPNPFIPAPEGNTPPQITTAGNILDIQQKLLGAIMAGGLITPNFKMTTTPVVNYVLTSDALGWGDWTSPQSVVINGGGLINPMTALGDMIYGGATPPGVPTRLPIGTNGQVLTVGSSGIPIWQTSSGSGGGEANTASNLGTGLGAFKQKTGVNLEFKSLKAGSGVTISQDISNITINTVTDDWTLMPFDCSESLPDVSGQYGSDFFTVPPSMNGWHIVGYYVSACDGTGDLDVWLNRQRGVQNVNFLIVNLTSWNSPGEWVSTNSGYEVLTGDRYRVRYDGDEGTLKGLRFVFKFTP